MTESFDVLPDANSRTIRVVPNDQSNPYTMDIEPSDYAASEPVTMRVMGNVYLWWIALGQRADIHQSYTPFPTDVVGIQVYDVFGTEIHQAPTASAIDSSYGFVFNIQHDKPTPVLLLFDIDATIETTTYKGEPISDTFVPTVTWIAVSEANDNSTVLNVAIPTVGQLYAIGGRKAIGQQISLMESFLERNKVGLALLTRIRNRIMPVMETYARSDTADWLVLKDCEECPEMVVVPAQKNIISDLNIDMPRADFAMGVTKILRQDILRFIKATDYKIQDPCADIWRDAEDELNIVVDRSYSWFRPGHDAVDTDPVVCIGWDDAQAYADWLSSRAGVPYRLLTLSESIYFAHRYAMDKPGTMIDGLLAEGENLENLEWVRDCWSVTLESSDEGSVSDNDECSRRTALTIDVTSRQYYRVGVPSETSGRNIGFRLVRNLHQTREVH